MSSTEEFHFGEDRDARTVDGGSIDSPPAFRLEFSPDDLARPSEVTIFDPDTDDIATHWLTVDAEHAVPIEEVP